MRSTNSRTRWLGVSPMVVLVGLGLVIMSATALLDSRFSTPNEPDSAGPMLYISTLAYIAVGGLILNRLPRHRIGWVFAAIGFSLVFSGAAGTLADDHGLVAAGAVGGALWFTWPVLAGFLMLWYPSGRPPTPHWRWLEWVGYLGLTIAVSYTFAGRLCGTYGDDACLTWVENPIGFAWVPNPEYEAGAVSLTVLPVFVVGSAVSLVTRLIRSRGVERLQLKWLVYAVLALIAWISLSELVEGMVPFWLGEVMFALVLVGLPASGAVAILRYRLYDIDRIISRTVSYSLVIAGLGLTALALVSLLALFLPSDDPLVVAVATLAAAALFNPLRLRVQSLVDRRFNRTHYNSERVIDAFTGSLQDRVDPSHVVEGWVGVVEETMEPAIVGVWLKDRS